MFSCEGPPSGLVLLLRRGGNGPRSLSKQVIRNLEVVVGGERTIPRLVNTGEKIARAARITNLSWPTIYRVLRNNED